MGFRTPIKPVMKRTHNGIKRGRTLGTRVTEAEYQRALAATGGLSPSEWVRSVVLASLDHTPVETVLLARFIALERVMTNVMVRLAEHKPVTEEWVRQLREHAGRDSLSLAVAALKERQP